MTDESISAPEQQTGQRTAVEVLDQCLVGGTGEDHHANYDQPMELQLRLRFRRDVEGLRLRIALRTDAGDLLGVIDLRADIEVDGMDRADRRPTLLGAP
jgi:hypothetical protein